MIHNNIMTKWREFNPGATRSITQDFSSEPSKYQNEILRYLENSGEITIMASKRAIDVVSGETLDFSEGIRADGEFSWNISLGYYVRKYNLKIPEEFEKAIMGSLVR